MPPVIFDLKTESVMEGEYLVLFTATDIERGEQVEWSFEGKTLATGMNEDIKQALIWWWWEIQRQILSLQTPELEKLEFINYWSVAVGGKFSVSKSSLPI